MSFLAKYVLANPNTASPISYCIIRRTGNGVPLEEMNSAYVEDSVRQQAERRPRRCGEDEDQRTNLANS